MNIKEIINEDMKLYEDIALHNNSSLSNEALTEAVRTLLDPATQWEEVTLEQIIADVEAMECHGD